jgi:hypothetical protein
LALPGYAAAPNEDRGFPEEEAHSDEGRRRQMTVLDLISRWTPEERERQMDLILECLERERFLVEIKRSLKRSEGELARSLDLLLSRIDNLAENVRKNADQILNIYLCLAKGGGNG